MPYTIQKDGSGYWVVKLPSKKRMHKKAYKSRKAAVRYLMKLEDVTEGES